jgi:hypothetical protein
VVNGKRFVSYCEVEKFSRAKTQLISQLRHRHAKANIYLLDDFIRYGEEYFECEILWDERDEWAEPEIDGGSGVGGVETLRELFRDGVRVVRVVADMVEGKEKARIMQWYCSVEGVMGVGDLKGEKMFFVPDMLVYNINTLRVEGLSDAGVDLMGNLGWDG